MGTCDAICDISLIFTMCSVSLQQDCIENKIDLTILQRCITKIYSDNVPTKVSVLNSQRARRQEMLNCLLALVHVWIIFSPKLMQAYGTSNPKFSKYDFLNVGTFRTQN